MIPIIGLAITIAQMTRDQLILISRTLASNRPETTLPSPDQTGKLESNDINIQDQWNAIANVWVHVCVPFVIRCLYEGSFII